MTGVAYVGLAVRC